MNTGNTVKDIFGSPTSDTIFVSSKLTPRSWEGVINLVKDSQQSINLSQSGVSAVHIHNENMIGDVLELIRVSKPKHERGIKLTKNEVDGIVGATPHPFVWTNSVDENWGFLSTPITTRTARWVNLTNHLRIHIADYDVLRYFLDTKKLVLMVVNSHIDPMLGAHEKVISLPLGVKLRHKLFRRFKEILALNLTKSKLLTINNSGWGDRTKLNFLVSTAFDNKTINSFKLQTEFRDHYEETARSKFMLCPSGLGMDSYRIWETLIFGTIPIVETNAGFDRTYSSLPVLVVQNYSSLTPEFLEEAYPCFVKHARYFRYRHLTTTYWRKLIYKAVVSGNITHVNKNHPFKNPYCDFSHVAPLQENIQIAIDYESGHPSTGHTTKNKKRKPKKQISSIQQIPNAVIGSDALSVTPGHANTASDVVSNTEVIIKKKRSRLDGY